MMINLEPQDFPFTIEALRSDNREMVWGLTLVRAPGGEHVQVRVPPLEEGPVWIRTMSGEGVVTETGPYRHEHLV